MKWTRAVELAVLLLSTACIFGEEQVTQFIALPDQPGTDAFLVHLKDTNKIYAGSVGQPFRRSLEEYDVEVHLLLYDRSLVALELTAGEVIQGSSCRSCALLKPTGVYRTMAKAAGTSPPWESVDLPESIANALVPDRERCSPCTRFASETIDIPGDDRIEVTVRYDDESILIANEAGIFRVSIDGSVEQKCRDGAWVQAGYRTHDALWLADKDSRLRHLPLAALDPDRECAAITTRITAPFEEQIAVLDGATSTTTEIYAMTKESRFVRYDGEWEVLATFDPTNSERDVRSYEDQTFGVTGGEQIARVRHGQVTIETVVVDHTTRISAVEHLERYGFVLGSHNDLLILEDGSEWRYAGHSVALDERVDAIAPFRDGILFTIRIGRLREYHPDIGYCPVHSLFSDHSVYDLIAARDEVFFATARDVYLVRPVAKCD